MGFNFHWSLWPAAKWRSLRVRSEFNWKSSQGTKLFSDHMYGFFSFKKVILKIKIREPIASKTSVNTVYLFIKNLGWNALTWYLEVLITQRLDAFHSCAQHNPMGQFSLVHGPLTSSVLTSTYLQEPQNHLFINKTFSEANLWPWNLSFPKVRPWDYSPHKNGRMVHISPKGARKVNQDREISGGCAFL